MCRGNQILGKRKEGLLVELAHCQFLAFSLVFRECICLCNNMFEASLVQR